jgi:hypothetical protein
MASTSTLISACYHGALIIQQRMGAAMNNQERAEASQLARKGEAVDKITNTLVEYVFAEPAPGSKVQGVEFAKSAKSEFLFEARTHHITLLARYVHHLAANDIVGRIYFCRQQLDGSVGDALLQVAVLANGDVEFPDGETLDLWPENNPEPSQVQRGLAFQLLKAAQASLTAL